MVRRATGGRRARGWAAGLRLGEVRRIVWPSGGGSWPATQASPRRDLPTGKVALEDAFLPEGHVRS